MAKDSRTIPPTQLTRKWMDQDVNGVSEFDHHGVRLPSDYIKWSELSGEVVESKLSEEELAAYNAKRK